MGVLLCMVGLSMLLVNDVRSADSNTPSSSNSSSSRSGSTSSIIANASGDSELTSSSSSGSSIFGDFLALGATLCYAISNVGQEYFTKQVVGRSVLGACILVHVIRWTCQCNY
jgi:drug/metabolite transporter (DMT)-like permease